MVAASELNIDTSASAMAMAQNIFGDNVQINSASVTGSGYQSGIYTGGDTTSPGVVPSDTGVILSTGNATDFTNSAGTGDANQNANTSTNAGGPNGNSLFDAAAGASTFDATWIDVAFEPTGDMMTMQFVFGSEEYPEYVNSVFNDLVGVWVNNEYINVEIGTGNTNVNNVSNLSNENLYIDNTNSDYNTEMDGFTVTMTLTFPVNAGEENTIRIGIADVGDSSYDSNLLIAGNSLQSDLIATSDTVEMFANGSQTVDLLANDVVDPAGTLTITHINGQPVVFDSNGEFEVTLTTGQVVTLDSSGAVTVAADGDLETVNFSYSIADGLGNTDTAFVTVDVVPCFVAGTMILTPQGEVPVESLAPGDLVITADDGPQPLRWVGGRTVPAEGPMAPIRIRAGTFGDHRDITVSPQHRLLVRDSLAELLFGEPEVLVAAKELVNDRSVQRKTGGSVSYVHLLFDKHQVVWSEGLLTESFLPGGQMSNALDRAVLDEICEIFPELDPATGRGYSPSARRTLKSYEAQVLRTLQNKAKAA